MVTIWVVFWSVVPVFVEDLKSPKRDFRIADLMREAHVKGRQTYRSLDQLLVSGRSRAEERRRFAEIYSKLRDLKPPQGMVESWRFDIDRVLGIVKDMDNAKDEAAMLKAGIGLLSATNCQSCHEKYRYAPKPALNEPRPKSLDAGLKAVAAGGKHWSSLDKLVLGDKTLYLQPGRRLVVWPAEDVVYEARRDGNWARLSVKFRWALMPGASFMEANGLLWYETYDLGNKNSFSYYHARPDMKSREGEFTESLTVWAKDRGPGEYEFVFVPQAHPHGQFGVPASNFVKVRYRLGK